MKDLVNNFSSDDDEVNLQNEPLSIKKEDFEMKKNNRYPPKDKYFKKRIQYL